MKQIGAIVEEYYFFMKFEDTQMFKGSDCFVVAFIIFIHFIQRL